MADDKKKAPAGGGGSGLFHKGQRDEVIFFLLPALFLVSILINRFLAYLDSLKYTAAASAWERFLLAIYHFWSLWKPFAVVISVAAAALIIHSYFKYREIVKAEEKIYGHATEDSFLEKGPGDNKENTRWQKVLAHTNSNNPAEWRLAIIEADIMLDELLKRLGYDGEGVAEMLKKIEPSDMLTLDKAWEAHKVRNRIAHSGAQFDLSERETRRIIALFEEVFNEFQII